MLSLSFYLFPTLHSSFTTGSSTVHPVYLPPSLKPLHGFPLPLK